MKIAIAGLGLIGGSFFKAFTEAGFDVTGFDKDDPVDVAGADVVLVALHPILAVEWIREHSSEFKDGATVVDTCGVKRYVMERVDPASDGSRWHFVGGHPMAGKEVSGFRNSDADLFRHASMILVPRADTPQDKVDMLTDLFMAVGFKKVKVTDAACHDSRIAYTSQLCHILSSAYLRDELATDYNGFSAGSFRDMIRVGAPDPALWAELFDCNRDDIVPVIDRFLERVRKMRDAIAAGDTASVSAQLAEGKRIKDRINIGDGGTTGKAGKGTKAWRSREVADAISGLARRQQFAEEWRVPK